MKNKNNSLEPEYSTGSEYSDLKKAADYLGCSIDTLRNRIEDGSLPAYRFGGRLIRVKKSDLEKLFHLIPSAATK